MDNELVFSIPAEISILPNETNLQFGENSFVTPVRLKVFYKGTTPDGRTFTEDFSSKVIKTLPQTPVVAYYDEEEEDFVGHNYEQYVYGYVPEVGKLSFEEIDGQTWAVTDIVLFTGRQDNIGKVAKKIIGKKHSLELDSQTTKYTVLKDSVGRVKEVVFTEGSIIGLSVLGDKQTPGFTGSEFFTEKEKTVQELITQYADLKEQLHVQNFVELFNSENNKDGGVEMTFSTETVRVLNDFMKETYDEVMRAVFEAVVAKFGDYVYVVQMSEDAVVFVDYSDGQYYRVTYSKTDAGFEFSEKIEVKPRFLTDEEIQNTFVQTEPQATPAATEPENQFDDLETRCQVFVEAKVKELEIPEGSKVLNAAEIAQIEQDRAELGEFRKGLKAQVVAKFAKFLTKEELEKYNTTLDSFSMADLEKELSFVAMQKVLQDNQESGTFKAAKIIEGTNGQIAKSETDHTIELINRYK